MCSIKENQTNPRLYPRGASRTHPPSVTIAPRVLALTWSSRGSSQKAGMYLAHSTSTSSCSFMDSHTSAMLAIFFARMSPLIPETGEVI